MGQFLDRIVRSVNLVGVEFKKHGPEILTGVGIVGGVAATVLACIATVKEQEIIGEAEAELDAIDDTLANKEDYTEEQATKDKRRVVLRTVGKTAANYALSATVGTAAGASIIVGAGWQHARVVDATGLAAAAGLGLKSVKDGLIKKYGKDEGLKLYNELRHGITEEVIEEEVIDEKTGKKKKVKKTVKVLEEKARPKTISYVRVYDWTNPYYRDDMTYNRFFVNAQQNYFNDKLKSFVKGGYVFMNEVDEALGFPKTEAGQIVGWRYDPDDPKIDNYIDFSVTEVYKTDEYGIKRPCLVLEYNVDGSILNKVDWEVER